MPAEGLVFPPLAEEPVPALGMVPLSVPLVDEPPPVVGVPVPVVVAVVPPELATVVVPEVDVPPVVGVLPEPAVVEVVPPLEVPVVVPVLVVVVVPPDDVCSRSRYHCRSSVVSLQWFRCLEEDPVDEGPVDEEPVLPCAVVDELPLPEVELLPAAVVLPLVVPGTLAPVEVLAEPEELVPEPVSAYSCFRHFRVPRWIPRRCWSSSLGWGYFLFDQVARRPVLQDKTHWKRVPRLPDHRLPEWRHWVSCKKSDKKS